MPKQHRTDRPNKLVFERRRRVPTRPKIPPYSRAVTRAISTFRKSIVLEGYPTSISEEEEAEEKGPQELLEPHWHRTNPEGTKDLKTTCHALTLTSRTTVKPSCDPHQQTA